MNFPFTLPARYVPTGQRLEGGQGFIYVCNDLLLDRTVAIKVVKSKTNIDELQAEIAALSEIRSRHIVGVYDLLIARKSLQIGLVEEFVPGKSLTEFVNEIDQEKYLLILWQLACGIADIHAHKKIHRDIKPDNVRLDIEGIVKILDFGLVSDDEEPSTKEARGTICYRAPELYATGPVRYSLAVDVYAFGVLAWFLANEGKLCAAMREVPPASTRPMSSFAQVPVNLHIDIVKILDAAIQVSPKNRPKMASIRDLLERHLAYGRHRAMLTYQGKNTLIDHSRPTARLKSGTDALEIRYDGLSFQIASCEGNVYVNNQPISLGDVLPSSSVLTLGAPSLGSQRAFVPMNLSHPGIVL